MGDMQLRLSKRIYLAGNIIESEYREIFKNHYKGSIHVELINPFELVNQKLRPDRLVETDKLLILSCDVLVAKIEKFTAGTIMEVCYAFDNNKHVLIISNNPIVSNDPWIIGNSDYIFKDVESCINFINREIKGVEV